MNKTKILPLFITIVVVFAFWGTGCTWVEFSVPNENVEKSDDEAVSISKNTEVSTNKNEDDQSPEPSSSPSEAIEEFLNSTLGTLPEADLDEAVTRSRLSKKLRVEYDSDSAFVPMNFCIQDGPSAIAVDKDNSKIKDATATIRVKARYGSDWMDMWDFGMSLDGDNWVVDKITCLAQ